MPRPLPTALLVAAACTMGGGAFAQSINAAGDVEVDGQERRGALSDPLVAQDVRIGSGFSGESGRLVVAAGASTDVRIFEVGSGQGATLGLLEATGFGTDVSAGEVGVGGDGGRGVVRVLDGASLRANFLGLGGFNQGVGDLAVGGFASVRTGGADARSGRASIAGGGLLRVDQALRMGDGGSFRLDVADGGRVEAQSFQVGSPNGGNASEVNLAGVATATNNGGFFLGAGSVLRLDGGTLEASSVSSNGGAIEGSGRINGRLELRSASSSNGRLTLRSTDAITVRGGQTDAVSSDAGLIENAGTLDLGDGFLLNGFEASYLGRGGTVRAQQFINQGSGAVDLLSGDNAFDATFDNRQGARVTVTGGATAVFQEDFFNQGSVRIDSGSRATFAGDYSGGLASGGGQSIVLGDLRFSVTQPASSRSARLAPSTAAEAVGTRNAQTIEGTLTLPAGSSLTLGFRADQSFDAFDFGPNGLLELDGSGPGTGLNLELATGFSAENGDRFEVFRVFDPAESQVTGTFALGPEDLEIGGGLRFDASELISTGFLTVVPEPGSVALLLGGAGLVLRRRRA